MARAQSKIGQLMYEQHLKQNQVAKLLGVTPQAVGRWVRGEAFPEGERLEALAQLLKVAPAFLRSELPADTTQTVLINDNCLSIPVISFSCSAGSPEQEFVKMIRVTPNWILTKSPAANLEALKIFNALVDSMEPTLPVNGFMFVDTSVDTIDRDGIYLFELNNQVFVKRIQRLVNGSLNAISDNPKYPAQKIEADDIPKIRVAGRCIITCTARAV